MMNLCAICDIHFYFYHVTSSVSSVLKHEATVHIHWFSMSIFPGGQLIWRLCIFAYFSHFSIFSHVEEIKICPSG